METLVQCGEREMSEETGLDLSLGDYRFIDSYSRISTDDFFPIEDKHYVTLFLRAQYLRGIPRNLEPERCEGWDWYKWKDIPKIENFFGPIGNLIKQGYDPFKL
jgi:8-oxo-dGTP diphosphatase